MPSYSPDNLRIRLDVSRGGFEVILRKEYAIAREFIADAADEVRVPSPEFLATMGIMNIVEAIDLEKTKMKQAVSNRLFQVLQPWLRQMCEEVASKLVGE